MKDYAVLTNDGKYTIFEFNNQRVRFVTSDKLERYTKVVEWDNGYLVVMAKYKEMPEVEEYAQMGLIPEGAYRNRDFAGDEVRSEIKELWMEDLVFDPQTSGGLLLAVPAEEADALAEELAGMDIFGGVIGYVTELQDKAVVFE